MYCVKTIHELYKKKTKIKDENVLRQIILYLNDKGYFDYQFTIKFGKMKKSFFNINLVALEKLKVRAETIDKINSLITENFIKKIFRTSIIIKTFFEETSTRQREIIKEHYCYNHDVILKIYNEEKQFELGYEYNETEHSKTIKINNDNTRDLNSNMFLDSYNIYNESSDNYQKFMEKKIFNILIIACALTDDEYKLAKIFYLSDNENITEDEEEIFDKILGWKKQENQINFEDFHNSIVPRNDETQEDYSYEGFIEYLENNHDIKIKNNKCDFETIQEIINLEGEDCSIKIPYYRKITSKVLNKLVLATKKIIEIKNENYKKMNTIGKFVKSMVENLHTIKDDFTVDKGIENLLKKQSPDKIKEFFANVINLD